jgi:seryl-tRNA synthetase
MKRSEIQEELKAIRDEHEPGIREVTDQLKDIANQINTLRVREKELQQQRNEKLLTRDNAAQKRREELRGAK